MKKAIRAAAFLLIAAAIFAGLDNLLARKSLFGWWNTTTKIHGFFNSEPDKYDIIFFGSSHAYCCFNPLVINEETGLDSYVIATQKQPLWATYYYIDEAIKRQSPQLVVLECYTASKTEEYSDDATNYTFTDDFPFGINKLKMIMEAAPRDKRFDLLFKFTKYHSRWSELTADDFGYKPDRLHDWLNGYCMLTGTKPDAEKLSSAGYDDIIPLTGKNDKWLKNIIRLCKENSAKLLIVKTPSNETATERGYYNAVAEIATENGVEFIDYNDLYGEIGLKMNEDFFDHAHLNHRGADKFSRYFAETVLNGFIPRGKTDYSSQLARYYREFGGDYNIFTQEPYFVK